MRSSSLHEVSMGNVIDWPKFNIRKQDKENKPIKVVCCENCKQAFFNIIVDDDHDDLIFECAMCGDELGHPDD